MRKYPVGIQSFESLRKGGYLYIDKTYLPFGLDRKVLFLQPAKTIWEKLIDFYIGGLLFRTKRIVSRIVYLSNGKRLALLSHSTY